MKEKLPKIHQHTTEELGKVQEIALPAQTMGIYRNESRKEYAENFANYAIEEIKKMHAHTIKQDDGNFNTSSNMLPFSILEKIVSEEIDEETGKMTKGIKFKPITESNKVWTLLHNTIKLHLAAFAKANTEGNLDTISALENTIFDLNSNREGVAENRISYLQALLETVLVHAQTINKDSWEDSTKLATYYSPEWLTTFLNGSLIEDYLSGKKGETHKESPIQKDKIDEFLKAYTSSIRMRSAVHNMKHPLKAVDGIYNNYLEVLSDENITIHLKARNVDNKEIEVFLKAYTSSGRMRSAVHNMKDPLKAVGNIFLGNLKNAGRIYSRQTGLWKVD